jgi:hypothetical protein
MPLTLSGPDFGVGHGQYTQSKHSCSATIRLPSCELSPTAMLRIIAAVLGQHVALPMGALPTASSGDVVGGDDWASHAA